MGAPFDEEEHERRPWEQPGSVRRDWEPHNGALLQALGVGSVVCAVMMFTSPIGLLLGVGAWVLAGRELARVRAGLVDPGGKAKAETGRILGIIGALLSLLYGLMMLAGFILG